MNDLKKKGHDINIKGIVIHQVIKEAHSKICSLKLADKPISPLLIKKRYLLQT